MKSLKKTAAITVVLVTLMFLPGCIGQEEELTTITETATETQIQTVTPVTTPGVTNPFIGSGKLDGEGIPLNFFADKDLRLAFAYAIDYDAIIKDALLGAATYTPTPILPGLAYHNPDQPGFELDLAKSEEYFKKAWNGEVWDKGFTLTATYDLGNEFRRISAEVMKRNVEQLNEKFFIYVRGVTWPSFLSNFLSSRFPLFVCNWVADYPDDHNLAQPFMHSQGTYAGSQRYSNPTVDALVEQGVAEVDPAKRKDIYYELQKLFVDDVISISLPAITTQHWERDWMNGWWYYSMQFAPLWWYLGKDPGAPNPNVVTYATPFEINTLDPAAAYDTASNPFLSSLYDTLIFYDHDPEKVVPKTLDPVELTHPVTKFTPVIAEEVPTVENGGISADGMTYTFKIKKGLKFPNGNDLTPEDVEYSFERAMVQDKSGGPVWVILEPLLGVYGTRDGDGNIIVPFEDIDKAVEVVGDTVVFHLAIPFAPFMQILTQSWASILDKEWCAENGCWDGKPETYPDYNNPEIEPLKEKVMGSGPFQLDYWTHGVEFSITKNEASAVRTAKIDRVIVKVISEWSTRKLLFLEGTVDICFVPIPFKTEVEGAPGIRSFQNLPKLDASCIFFNYDISPL